MISATAAITASRFTTRSALVAKPGSCRELGSAGDLTKLLPEPVIADREHQITIGRRKRLIGNDAGVGRAVAGWVFSGREVVARGVGKP